MASETFTFYIQPWYRKSPYFEATKRAGCKSWGLYNHMLLPTLYDDPVTEYRALAERRDDVGRERGAVRRDHRARRVRADEPDTTCHDLTTCDVWQCKYVLLDRCRRRHRERPGAAAPGGEPLLAGARGQRCAAVRNQQAAWRRDAGVDVTIREADVAPMQSPGSAFEGRDRGAVRRRGSGDLPLLLTPRRPSVDGIPVRGAFQDRLTGEVGYEIYLRDASRGDEHLWESGAAGGRAVFGIRADDAVGSPADGRVGVCNYGGDVRIEGTPFHVAGLEKFVELGPGARLHGEGSAGRN